ncbi:MAG: hypothetical protein IPH31_04860 [Lewinellaceae bacterium]|nr:hypothetical protein [Lewinellaceae bacterium]
MTGSKAGGRMPPALDWAEVDKYAGITIPMRWSLSNLLTLTMRAVPGHTPRPKKTKKAKNIPSPDTNLSNAQAFGSAGGFTIRRLKSFWTNTLRMITSNGAATVLPNVPRSATCLRNWT